MLDQILWALPPVAVFVVVVVAAGVAPVGYFLVRGGYRWFGQDYEGLRSVSAGWLSSIFVVAAALGSASFILFPGYALMSVVIAVNSAFLALAAVGDIRERRVPIPVIWSVAGVNLAMLAFSPGVWLIAGLLLLLPGLFFLMALLGHQGASDYRMAIALVLGGALLPLPALMFLLVLFAVTYLVWGITARLRRRTVPIGGAMAFAWLATVAAILALG